MPTTFMLQAGDAPGRSGDTPSAPPAAPAEAQTGAPATKGQPGPDGAQPGAGMGSLMMLLPFLLLFALIFLMQRGDKKKRAQLEEQLKKGDRVITRAGFIGKLLEIGDRTVKIEMAPGVKMTLLKSHIEGLDGGDTAAPVAKDEKGKLPAKSTSSKSEDKSAPSTEPDGGDAPDASGGKGKKKK